MRKKLISNRKVRIIVEKAGTLLLLVLLVILGRSVWNSYSDYRIAKQEYKQAEGDLNIISERRDGLESDIKRLSTDRGLEEEIRTKFQVAKEDEEVVVIVDKDVANTQKSVEPSLWLRIMSFFGLGNE